MRLDFDADRPLLAQRISEGVNAFMATSPRPLALPVTQIGIKFDLTTMDKPCVWAYFDTEPSGIPDSGTSARWMAMEQWCEHWAPACHACGDEPVTIRSGGRDVAVEDEDELNAAVGQFFVALLKDLRDVGVFNELSRAEECYLGVSTEGGGFGWPTWEDRGPDNMV